MSTSGIEASPSGASLVFYAWFIIGMFGFSLGEYAGQVRGWDDDGAIGKDSASWVTTPEPSGRDYPGLDEPVIEAVLWQTMVPEWGNLMPGDALDLEITIAGLHGTSGGSSYTTQGDPVATISVKPRPWRRGRADHKATAHSPLDAYLIPLQRDTPDEWVEGLFASVLADDAVVVTEFNEWGNNFERKKAGFPRLLTSDGLRRSMLQAFGSCLNQLMHRGNQATTVRPSGDGLVWTHQSLVSAKETIILSYGPVSPAVVAALLIFWAAFCLDLAVCYSFRRRWAETLDSYSVIRFGADAGVNGLVDGSDNPKEIEDCRWLKSLPGIVGDSLPGYYFGYITFADAVIDKKRYL
ncbi:hypothetical protein MMYC01_201081 [Madurella mycetomatis]|uniref:Uncharacterized protein n=1 Tax=Madurella mycetomatis TaxID=100816 RepID=A0A175WGK8_9PEZI|nr:hypothetical protein MMYC01_201081 [Madurella mycetomatis]